MTIHRVWLAGSKFGDGALIRGEIPEGMPLTLRREPDNQYDPNAVSVWASVADLKAAGVELVDGIPADKTHLKLGMLPASRGPNWAGIVSPMLAMDSAVVAKFRRHSKTQLRITIEGAALPEVVA